MIPNEEDKGKIDRLRQAMYSRDLADKLHERDRRELRPDMPLVPTDFQTEESKLSKTVVAPRTIGVVRNILWIILGIATVFFLGAAGFFGYYFTFGGGSLSTSPQNVDIVVSGPPQVPSGQPSQLQVVVTNRNQEALVAAELIITYPQGTRTTNTTPTTQKYACSGSQSADSSYDFSKQRVCLGTIEPGGKRQGTVSAVFSGAEGKPAPVKVELEYHLAGSNAVFVAETDYSMTYSSSAISIAVDGNQEIISGQPTEFTVTVTSNATTPLKDVLLSADFPFGYTMKSSDPSPVHERLWELGDLNPGQQRKVIIRGVLAGEQGDHRVFHFTTGTRTTLSHTQIDTSLAENTHETTISRPFLGLSLAVNKETGTQTSTTVSPGDNVVISIAYQNNLPVAVTDAVVVARLTGVQIDGSSVRSSDGFYRSSDAAVIWDKLTTKGALGNLIPGAKGTVSFSFQVPSSEMLKGMQNPSISVAVNAAGNRVSEAGVPEGLKSSLTKRISLGSDVQLMANALYYTNPFGSTGPMPARAGVETTYALVFTVTNTTNKITDAVVTAVLPQYVRWTGKYSPVSEDISFNPVTSTFTWKLKDVSPGTGVNGVPPRQAAVSIGVTPSTSQIGQQPPLVNSVRLRGFDASTGEAIQREAGEVNTNLQGDQGFSATNATVVK